MSFILRPTITFILLLISTDSFGQFNFPGKGPGKKRFPQSSVQLGETEINTLEVIEATIGCTDCLDWELKGICFFLKCSLFACSIKQSTKQKHYIPDAVVNSFTSKSPWKEMSFLAQPESGTAMHDETAPKGDPRIDFKNVEVIGNPGIAIFKALNQSTGFMCDGPAIPFFPYFVSANDKFWADSSIERLLPQALLGWPKIDAQLPLGYWAPVYPRCGWGAHPYDPINAAVAAHRAAEIVTHPPLAHVAIPLGNNCTGKCWPPPPTQANDNITKFQMIAPVRENSARSFGGSATWANGKYRQEEQYSFLMWRPYTCCVKHGSYLFSIDF